MKIKLKDIRLFARHGVMQDEQTIGAWFRVSLSVSADVEKATFTDNLEDTLSYATMADIIKEEMEKPSKLLEHVAGRMARRVLIEMPDIKELTITVSKENPPIGMECESSSVELTLGR